MSENRYNADSCCMPRFGLNHCWRSLQRVCRAKTRWFSIRDGSDQGLAHGTHREIRPQDVPGLRSTQRKTMQPKCSVLKKQGLRARGPLGPDVLRIQRRALDAGVFPDAIGVILDLLEAPPASPISKHVAQRPCDEPECPVPHVAPVDRWGGRILILRCRGLGRRFFRGQPNRSATSMAMKPQIENLATRATGQEPPVLFIRPSNLDDS